LILMMRKTAADEVIDAELAKHQLCYVSLDISAATNQQPVDVNTSYLNIESAATRNQKMQ